MPINYYCTTNISLLMGLVNLKLNLLNLTLKISRYNSYTNTNNTNILQIKISKNLTLNYLSFLKFLKLHTPTIIYIMKVFLKTRILWLLVEKRIVLPSQRTWRICLLLWYSRWRSGAGARWGTCGYHAVGAAPQSRLGTAGPSGEGSRGS